MASNFTFSRLADADLQNIYVYTTREFGVGQAEAYVANIHRAAELIGHFPIMGSTYETHGGRSFRKYSVGRHAMFYQGRQSSILIVRILHVAMDFDRHLDA